MATTATQHPTYPTPVQTEGPFGAQGERPGVGLPRAGEFAQSIERETAQWPASKFLWTALGMAGASLLLRQKRASRFLGPLLLFGVYKLAKRG